MKLKHHFIFSLDIQNEESMSSTSLLALSKNKNQFSFIMTEISK